MQEKGFSHINVNIFQILISLIEVKWRR